MRYTLYLIAVISFFAIGFTLGASRTHPSQDIACRPSAPERLPQAATVLFWGNSIAFDYDWALPGYTVVNCAVQGMTAEQAATRIDQLPEIEVSAIVLVFGSVELVRGKDDVTAFQAAITTMHDALESRYTGAQRLVLGVPMTPETPNVWEYARDVAPADINASLQRLNGITFLDPAPLLRALSPQAVTYDGVHLTRASYEVLETAIHMTLQ